jgi:hypothetical protein
MILSLKMSDNANNKAIFDQNSGINPSNSPRELAIAPLLPVTGAKNAPSILLKSLFNYFTCPEHLIFCDLYDYYIPFGACHQENNGI